MVQSEFQASGASAVAAWTMEALINDYQVSLLTWRLPDFEGINRILGTSLSSSIITVYSINPVLRKIIDLDPDPESFQKLAYLMRVCKKISRDYDVIISADNELDFGRRGILYLHYPYLHGKLRSDIDRLPWHRKLRDILLNGQYRPWMLISGFSFDRMKNNLTLVNSEWTGDRVRKFYGIEAKTVYPPVAGDFPDEAWEDKENGFVCIGRICPGKKFHTIIEILSTVKSKVPDIHLHIIGAFSTRREDREYHRQLTNLVRGNSSWVFLHENLSRRELVRLASIHRYGIHANIDEHFGIAVAEMLKAGCIVFTHDSGGQVEIVGGDERLVYRDKEEAVEKIMHVVNNPDVQSSIFSHLRSRKELFSTERFMSQIQEIVRQF